MVTKNVRDARTMARLWARGWFALIDVWLRRWGGFVCLGIVFIGVFAGCGTNSMPESAEKPMDVEGTAAMYLLGRIR